MQQLFASSSVASRPAALAAPSTNNAFPWAWITAVLVALGVVLRLYHFLDNRSLWIDETFLANSLIRLDFLALSQPALEYEQKAPILFLWASRLAVVLFGKGEMALRLVPLLCSLAGLGLFWSVARRLLRPLGVAVGLGVLALAPPLIYHGVEAKQYSAELLGTVGALWLYTRYHNRPELRARLLWGLGGAGLVWFSFASILVLMGIAGGVSLYYAATNSWRRVFQLMLPFGLWAVSFGINYFFFTGRYTESLWLVHWFGARAAFMPLPLSAGTIKWGLFSLYMMLDYPLGLFWEPTVGGSTLPRAIFRVVPLACLLLGLVALLRHDRKLFLALTLPVLLTLLAAALKKYPFYERLLVFLAPVLMLVVAGGAEWLAYRLVPRWRLVLPLLLLAPPLFTSGRHAANPRLFGGYKKSYFKEGLLFVNTRWQPGDVVYLYWNHQSPYRYYKEAYQLRYTAVQGRDVRWVSRDLPDYVRKVTTDFRAVAGGRRAWFVCNDLVTGIGDIETAPAWYYVEDIRFGDEIRRSIARRQPLQLMLRQQWTDAYLFAPEPAARAARPSSGPRFASGGARQER